MRRPPFLTSLSAAVLSTALAGAALGVPGVAASAAQPESASVARSTASAKPAYTVTPLWFSVQVGEDDDIDCTIVADLYLPKTASRRDRVPAILTTNGFGGSKDDQAGTGRLFASRGYAVLSYSGLGFGGSSCPISLDSPERDGKAARFLVSYLGGERGHAFLDAGLTTKAPKLDVVVRDALDHTGRHSAFDPRVGMIGGSYGGGAQFAAASVDPRIDTLIPLITWNDLSYSLAPNNVVANGDDVATGVTTPVHGAAKLIWAAGFSALGVVNGLQYAQADPQRLIGCPDFESWVCPSLVNAAATGTLDDATYDKLHDRSVVSFMKRIRIPVLLAQGQGDTLFNLNEAIATYRSLRAQGTPVKMLWSDGGHSKPYPPGEIVTDDLEIGSQYLTTRFAAWFDHHLKDLPVSTGPQFAYFRDWVDYRGSAAPAYASAPAFPLPGRRVLHLSDAALVAKRSQVVAGSQQFLTPIAGLPSSLDPADLISSTVPIGVPEQDLPGTTASFTTAALGRPLDVVGSPRVRLQVDTPLAPVAGAAGETALTLFLKILDVAPDGSSTLVRDLIAPVRVADPSKPFTVAMPAFVHRFAKGHHLQLVVAGGSLNYRGGLVPNPVTIATGPDVAGQVLTLPTR